MKQRTVKNFTLFTLVLVFCLTIVSGCSTTEGNTTTAAPGTSAPSATVAAPDNTGSTQLRPSLLEDEPNVTLPGELPIVEEPSNLTIAMAQDALVLDYDYGVNAQTTWMEDLSGIHVELELYPSTQGAEKFSVVVSSGAELPDVIVNLGVENPTSRFAWGQAGTIIPLQDYYKELGHFWNQSLLTYHEYTGDELISIVSSPDGNLYGAVLVDSQLRNHYPKRAYICTSWLEQLGMKSPTTQDELVAFLRACITTDLNGDGRTDDQIALMGNTGWHGDVIEYLMNQYIYVSNGGGSFYHLMDNGILDVAYDKDEWRDGLRFIKDLYEEGLISELSFTQSNSDYVALMNTDPPIVGIGVSGGVDIFYEDYESLGTIRQADGTGYHTYVPTTIRACAAITADCENPAMAFRWLEMGYQDEYVLCQRYGEEGVNWEYVDEANVEATMYDGIIDMGSVNVFFRQLKNEWGAETECNWRQVPLPYIFDTSLIVEAIEPGTLSAATVMTDSVRLNHTIAPGPSDVIVALNYTEAETTQYSEQRSVMQSYVKECMVRFVLGDIDIENDWDEYLQELENMGYQDLLAVDQLAYNRTMGIN